MPPAREAFAPIHYRMRFPALDGLRALPVTMVFAFHYGGGAASGPLLHNVSIMRLQGWSALNLFFTLSGFLITGVLYDTRNDSHFFKRFYARRVLRIFPVFYLLALVLLALTAVFRYEWRPQHLLFLVYLGNFWAAFMPSLYQVHARFPAANLYIGHLWTLCVEEQFYLLWPLLVWSIRDRVKLIWTAAGLSLIAVVLRVWLVYGVKSDLHGGWLLTMLPFHLDGLLIGAILALLMRGRGGGTIAAECPVDVCGGGYRAGDWLCVGRLWVGSYGWVSADRLDECGANRLGVDAGFVGRTSAGTASFAGFRQMQLRILCLPSAVCGGVGGAGEGGGTADSLSALGLCAGDGVELRDLIPGGEGEL